MIANNLPLKAFSKAICSSLLTFLGFSSCSDNEVMYGMPFGSFEIKGTVTDENGCHIEDAEIRVALPGQSSGIESFGTTRTGHDGNYTIRENEWSDRLKVVCIPDLTEFQPDSVIVDMNYKESHGHGEWNKGHAEKTVNFRLKKND